MSRESSYPDVLLCRTYSTKGVSLCDQPARYIVWGHLFQKLDKGPKCAAHLPESTTAPALGSPPAIYEIPQPVPCGPTATPGVRGSSAGDLGDRAGLAERVREAIAGKCLSDAAADAATEAVLAVVTSQAPPYRAAGAVHAQAPGTPSVQRPLT